MDAREQILDLFQALRREAELCQQGAAALHPQLDLLEGHIQRVVFPSEITPGGSSELSTERKSCSSNRSTWSAVTRATMKRSRFSELRRSPIDANDMPSLPECSGRSSTPVLKLLRQESTNFSADYSELKLPNALNGDWRIWPRLERGVTNCGGSMSQPNGSSEALGRPKLDDRLVELYNANKADSLWQLEEEPKRSSQNFADVAMSLSLGRGISSIALGAQMQLWSHRLCRTIHPHSPWRVTWDMVGLLFVLFDVVMIPFTAAWNPQIQVNGCDPLLVLSMLVTAFWAADLLLAFNTGHYADGKLVLSRARIAHRYLRTWFFFDIFLLLLDCLLLALPTDIMAVSRGMRSLRALRLVRALRLIKVSKLSLTLEDVFSNYGRRGVILVVAVIKTFSLIFLTAHFLTCAWYSLGVYGGRAGSDSWINLIVGFEDFSPRSQYLHSYHWVLGHLTAAPVDGNVAPQNDLERVFTVTMITSSLLVLGTGISKMSNTILELNRMNSETTDTKRSLQRYLQASGAPAMLSVRVIRFVLHARQRERALFLDSSLRALLSVSLDSDIIVCQREKYLLIHPLFCLIKDLHPQVLLEICKAFTPLVFSDQDVAFTAGTWSETLYITVHGVYELQGSVRSTSDMWRNVNKIQTFDEPTVFSETSLFARVIHQSTLKAITFADAFALSGSDLSQCARTSPQCINMLFRYGNSYLSGLWDVSITRTIPPGYEPIRDLMDPSLSLKACDFVRTDNAARSCTVTLEDTAPAESEIVHEFIAGIRLPDTTGAELQAQLLAAIPELNVHTGLYTQLSEEDERRRSVTSTMGVLWLLRNDYDAFTSLQSKDRVMSIEQWVQWQDFVRWVGLSDNMVHAMCVFLAIRGLGKAQILSKKLPLEQRSPENIVMHLLCSESGAVPSASVLNLEMQDLVFSALRVHSKFNMAQMLQGENLPCQVGELQECVGTEGDTTLKFYLLALVGIMCGIRGTESMESALFMDEENGQNVLLGIQCLKHLEGTRPAAIYWHYICARAERLGLPTSFPEQLAMARLACLVRTSPATKDSLINAWGSLTQKERSLITAHFLADGIEDSAFLFSFLPQFFANSCASAAVGLGRALVVFIELIEHLKMSCVARVDHATTIVNLLHLANFVRDVRSSALFEAVVRHVKVVAGHDQTVIVTLDTDLLQCAGQTVWHDDPKHEVLSTLHKLERRAESAESLLEVLSHGVAALRHDSFPHNADDSGLASARAGIIAESDRHDPHVAPARPSHTYLEWPELRSVVSMI